MVNVEHRALGALKQYRLAVVECAVEQHARSRKQTANVPSDFQILVEQSGCFEGMAIRCTTDRLLLFNHALELVFETVRVEQVAHSYPPSRHFIFVGRSDSA